MNKEHKDPNGKTCKGKKDPQHPKCWHCDTCPYAKCVEDPQSPSENWEEKTGRLIAEARIEEGIAEYSPQPSEDWERRLRKTGWFPHLETLGKRSLEEFLGCIQNFIDEALSTQKSKLIRDYDKKYNQLCEDKVREERERLIGEIRKWKRSGSVGGQYVNYSDALDDVLKLLEQNNEENT